MQGVGNEGKSENGDVILEFEIEKEIGFEIDGNDLLQEIEIGFVTAIRGGEERVNVLNGFVELDLPINSVGKKFRIKGHGLNGGNMIIECVVKIPSWDMLSRDEKEILFELGRYENFK